MYVDQGNGSVSLTTKWFVGRFWPNGKTADERGDWLCHPLKGVGRVSQQVRNVISGIPTSEEVLRILDLSPTRDF